LTMELRIFSTEAAAQWQMPSRQREIRSARTPFHYQAGCREKAALWFVRKSYEHTANEPALPDAVVTPDACVTARW
jgi:hypothetical protein